MLLLELEKKASLIWKLSFYILNSFLAQLTKVRKMLSQSLGISTMSVLSFHLVLTLVDFVVGERATGGQGQHRDIICVLQTQFSSLICHGLSAVKHDIMLLYADRSCQYYFLALCFTLNNSLKVLTQALLI